MVDCLHRQYSLWQGIQDNKGLFTQYIFKRLSGLLFRCWRDGDVSCWHGPKKYLIVLRFQDRFNFHVIFSVWLFFDSEENRLAFDPMIYYLINQNELDLMCIFEQKRHNCTHSFQRTNWLFTEFMEYYFSRPNAEKHWYTF